MADRRPPDQVEESRRRRAEVMRLRRTGMTFEKIGEQLGITKQAAHKLYKATLAEIPVDEVETYRAEQLERLDALLVRANEVLDSEHITVSNGRVVMQDGEPLPDSAPVLAAIKAVLDIEARRAKLLGLDQQKQQIEMDGGLRYEVVGISPDLLK